MFDGFMHICARIALFNLRFNILIQSCDLVDFPNGIPRHKFGRFWKFQHQHAVLMDVVVLAVALMDMKTAQMY